MLTLDQLTYILQQDCKLLFAKPILIGVSGGPDSLCLMDYLWKHGYKLVVAHLNHGLRADAEHDANIVRQAAKDRGVPFIYEVIDVSTFAKNRKLSIEEAARIVRYQFLFEKATRLGAQAVAVAHTADDQVETVLMHILRGTGLSGLKGMSYRLLPNFWSDKIALVRPLLGITRDEVVAYCSEYKLSPVFDQTNKDTTLYRNRIRHELIPILESYNPKIKSLLWRMSQIILKDDQVLEQSTDVAWNDCLVEQNQSRITSNVNKLLAYPISIQRRLIRRVISVLKPGLRDIDFSMIERTLKFINHPSRSGKLDLTNDLFLILEGENLTVSNTRELPSRRQYPSLENGPLLIKVPDCVELTSGWRIQTELFENIQGEFNKIVANQDPYQAWVEIKSRRPIFEIRNPRPGDRFQPIGMDSHSVKISDFFINVKVQRRMRRVWPLVCIDDNIVWVPGFRIAYPYRITENTVQAVYLHVFKV